jgi:hypothetical protein
MSGSRYKELWNPPVRTGGFFMYPTEFTSN